MFFATNYLGICGIEGIKKLGLRMPEDIAVARFDEHDLFRLHDPGITCISQPPDQIARAVVDVLVREMDSETGTEHTTKLMLPSSDARRVGQEAGGTWRSRWETRG